MQIQNKTEIKLSIEDLSKIVSDYLSKEYKTYDWIVKNKPIQLNYRYIIDNYVFDTLDITVRDFVK